MYRKPEIVRSRNSAPLYPFVPDDEKEITAKPNKISYARRTNAHSNDDEMECNKTVVTLANDDVSSPKTLTPIHASSASVNPISLENHTKEQQHTAINVQSPPVIMVVKECVPEEATNDVRQPHMSPKGLKIPSNVSSTRNSLSVSSISPDSSDERPESRLSFIIRERLHSFAKDINRRTSIVKQCVIQKPPTPDEISLASAVTAENDQQSLQMKIDAEDNSSFASTDQKCSCRNVADIRKVLESIRAWIIGQLFKCDIFAKSIESRHKPYMFWLAFVSMSFLYNAFAIPLRAAYPYQTEENLPIWMCFDYISDGIYFIDVVFVKTRIRFMKDGLPVKDVKVLAKRYLNSWQFKLCILSLLPTDLLYLTSLCPSSLLRLNRLLKITSYWEFFLIMDNVVKNPYAVRVLKTLLNLIYVIHVNSCVFYALSSWEGIGSNMFVYTGKGNAYLRCFYFATKLATSVGNTEDPTNVLENVFMLISWLKGVFIVAILLGQIRDIVATATKNREEFRNVMDDVLAYCNLIKLSDDGRLKVQHWFSYTWEEQKTLDENKFLTTLPKKLRTELAISVHYDVLNKVQLFKDCDKALLRDLVLKLKPVLFLPGDYICKKGEIGKEMYIVSKGILEVIGGPNGTTIFATLREGSVFGEVSLLAIGGGNRRTADVRSKGFSNLFILSKDDLNEAIKDHPEAQKILKHKARKLLRKHEIDVKEEKLDMEQTSVVTARPPTPKLLLAVAQVINPNSPTGQQLLNSLSSASPPILNANSPNQGQFLSVNDAAKNDA